MAEEKKNLLVTSKAGRGARGGGRGRGSRGGSHHSSSPSAQHCHQNQPSNQQRHPGRGRNNARENNNHGRHPKSHQQHRNNQSRHNHGRPRSHSYNQLSEQQHKKFIEGPYAHLFTSERHGFALSRVFANTPEMAPILLPNCTSDATSRKITSSQLEKWWEAVKLVRCLVPYDYQSSSNANPNLSSLDRCPICLDEEMIAPSIFPCGHSFCLPCVLGYLNSVAKQLNLESERICKSKQLGGSAGAVVGQATKSAAVSVTSVCARCPCCSSGNSNQLNAGESIITYKDMRPVVFVPVGAVQVEPVNSGRGKPKRHQQQRQCSRMRFVKLHRVEGCSAPYLPVEGRRVRAIARRDDTTPLQWTFDQYALPDGDDDEECIYTRQYYVGTNEYDALLERNLHELIQYRDESAYCQMDSREKWNASMAVEAVQASIRRWVGTDGEDGGFRSMERMAKSHGCDVGDMAMIVPVSRSNVEDSIKENEDSMQTKNDALIPPGTAYLNKELDEFLYYQSCDGQLCFLSGINQACLLEEYSLHRNEHSSDDSDPLRRALPLPDVVHGVVIAVANEVVTSALTKKKHFLSHLPFGTRVSFVEIDWYSGGENGHKPMLTKATLNKFRSEIQRRKSDRQRASQMEDKADKAARIRIEKEDRRRRVEAFGSAYAEGASRQTIDPDDEFFKMPSASMEEALDDSLQHTAGSSTFRFNEVCATGGVWPELTSPTAPMMSPAPPVATNAKSHPTSPVGSSWGSSSVQHLMRQTPLQSVASPRIEAFPTLSKSVHTKKSCPGSTPDESKSCRNKK